MNMRFPIKKTILPLLLIAALLFPSSAYAASPGVPDFSGAAAIELEGCIPDFSPDDFTGEDYVAYSELDALGRPGPATACLSGAALSRPLRADSGASLPVGWETARYDDLIDGRYLYTLSYLLSPALGGADSDARNIFTGTRYLRAEGMRPFEDVVAGFLKRTAYHILYRVTPVCRGDELVPTGVQMEAYSVEDAGRSVCFNVFVYNVQPGIEIDYRSGKSAQSASVEVTLPAGDILHLRRYQARPGTTAPSVGSFSELGKQVESDSQKAAAASPAGKPAAASFILNTQTKVYHTRDCGHLPAAEYRRDFTGTPQELQSMGYYDWCDLCRQDAASGEKKASSPADSTAAAATEKESTKSEKKSLLDMPESAIDKMAGTDLTDKLRYDDSVYEKAIYGDSGN